MEHDIMVVGAGGFGREAVWTLERINAVAPTWRVIGFADDDPAKAHGSLEGYPLLGTVAQASRDYPGAHVLIAVGDNATREKIYRSLRGHDFPVIIDPSAEVAPTVEIRHGTFIGPKAVVSVGAELGKFVIVNARAGVGHDSKLGDFSQVCPGATLSGHTTLGDHAFVATNASTVPGITIGARAKVAAGTPVYGNLADDATLSPFGVLKKAVCALALLLAGTSWAVDADAFANPSKDHRPETWFHLIGGNVAKAGLAADLDAVAYAGISGIQLFHGQFGGPWPGVSPQIPCLSKDWDDLIRFAADGCAERGLSFKMQNCPGWSMSGGPWIAPSNAMRNLTYSRTDVSGGKPLKLELPVPDWQMESRLKSEDLDYHDLFVLAFPTPAGDTPEVYAPKPAEKTDKDGVLRLVYRFPQPVAFRSLELPSPRQMNHDWAYAPGVTMTVRGSGARAASAEMPQGCWQDGVPFTMSLGDQPPSKEWTVEIEHAHPISVSFVRFRTGARLHNWEGQAGWVLRGLEGLRQSVSRLAATSAETAAQHIRGDAVLDLTDKFKDGTLDWTPPEGKWTVLRIGHVNNGTRNGPAPKEATGWECSKMDRAGIDAHFAAYIGRLAKGPLAGGKLKGFVVDSWECRRQTWTRSLEADFRSARGYDFRKKLPAVFGWVIDSPEKTEDFLRDWRQTLGELVEKNYYARMDELARAYGMTAQYETAFGDVVPGDLMAFWKYCDTPMCEFWFPRAESSVGQDDFKPIIPCASAAHVYGKRRVAAEACTTTRLKWDEDFKNLKGTINHAFARGVTHLVFHTYTHNPRTDWLPPGSSFGHCIGTPFIRGQSWWKHMPEFTMWVARCETMLEAGRPANDILWYLGEGVGHKPSERSPFPEGYKYDYVNTDALLNRIVAKDGKFATPEGITWKVLWVPERRWLSAAVKAKLSHFIKCGSRVVYGSAADVVEGIKPDVTCEGDGPADWRKGERPVDWLHRRDAMADWYFVAANGMDPYDGEVTFRAEGTVSVWDPVTGARRTPEIPHMEENSTTVKMRLAPAECVFVVFEREGVRSCATATGETSVVPAGESLKWTLSFPGGWGAPASIKLDKLASWTDLPLGEEGRHFSGTASYTATFNGKAGASLTLDLGEVETVADVFVNGKKVRTLWAPPYRCAIGPFVKDGANDLRVEVTSTWFNRLAYDAGLPEKDRKTWTIAAPKKGTPLKPAGLLGPVVIR